MTESQALPPRRSPTPTKPPRHPYYLEDGLEWHCGGLLLEGLENLVAVLVTQTTVAIPAPVGRQTQRHTINSPSRGLTDMMWTYDRSPYISLLSRTPCLPSALHTRPLCLLYGLCCLAYPKRWCSMRKAEAESTTELPIHRQCARHHMPCPTICGCLPATYIQVGRHGCRLSRQSDKTHDYLTYLVGVHGCFLPTW